ncbi:hypothetical protein BK816_01670 [Boudabousia tangfeifanii]|uniref:Uncharacterized protein n=1 Tax=Boudabousia tangfeifanii TaxID=1912795 RepID=A0A1D9MIP2_9ACTO|nr:hypothetical protein [Boudabousia tangfeifanii]AOZ72164.1 hypothetical protein BK816_01670 [Boudabousia tangfeifanii]
MTTTLWPNWIIRHKYYCPKHYHPSVRSFLLHHYRNFRFWSGRVTSVTKPLPIKPEDPDETGQVKCLCKLHDFQITYYTGKPLRIILAALSIVAILAFLGSLQPSQTRFLNQLIDMDSPKVQVTAIFLLLFSSLVVAIAPLPLLSPLWYSRYQITFAEGVVRMDHQVTFWRSQTEFMLWDELESARLTEPRGWRKLGTIELKGITETLSLPLWEDCQIDFQHLTDAINTVAQDRKSGVPWEKALRQLETNRYQLFH